MDKIIILLLMFSSALVNADQIYLGGKSKHFDFAKATNSNHHFIAYERNNLIVGGFLNSYGNDTIFTAIKFPHYEWSTESFSYSSIVGISKGYRSCHLWQKEAPKARVCPIVAFQAQYNEWNYNGYTIAPTGLIIIGGAVIMVAIKF
jgi:hypothetical protein